MASGNQIKFGVNYQVDKASIQKVKKSLQDLQNVKPASFAGTREELRQVQSTAEQVELALNKAFNVKLGSLNTTTFNNQLREAGLNVEKIYASFSKMGVQGQVAFSEMASSVLTTNLRLKETSNIVSKMGQTMANTAKWGIASSVMNSFTNEVRQAFQYVKSLDSALTDIRIVTGDSTQKMAQFAEQANKAAQILGRSTMDYSKAALTFYQQGLSDEDVQARTEATLKAQNITGAGDEMADYLTAVWNGYKVANEEAELYVDKLAAVADSSASNMAQLATAMSKVASSANMLGVPVDKLNAQIATITATTRQAPQTVGNALKTIYSRINDIATGSEDAQISLGNYSSKMQEVGFSVLDASGHLRDTGDVIDQIGEKWNTLSREQQIYLARTMAGQRQYNNLLALFENWGRYTDLVTVSMDAQGATMEKNQRYLDSLAAKTEQFGAAQERVKSALIDENDLKGIVDFGTGFVNTFSSLIEGIGGGRNALLALGSIFTSVFSGTISKQINNFIVNIQNARSNTQALKNDIANLQSFKAFGGNNDAVKQLTTHIGELQKYYSVLDQATINNQKNLIGQLDTLQNNKMQLQANKKAVIQYAESVHIANVQDIWEKDSAAVEELNSAIGRLQGSSSNLQQVFHSFLNADSTVQRLEQHFNEFIEAYEQINPDKARQLQNAFNNIGPQSGQFRQLLNQALDQANTKANLYSDTINNATQRQQELNNKTQQLTNIIRQNEKGFKQLFDVNSVVKFASSIGQIASVISTVVNLTKTWKDENVSLGQKLTRTFTTIGFMIPMLVSSYKNISESLGLQLLKQTKITLEKEKQLLLERQIAIEKEKTTAKKLYSEAIYGKNGVDWDKYNTASKMLGDLNKQSDQINKSLKGLEEEAGKLPSVFGQIKSKATGALSSIIGFLSGPAGIVIAVGALATLIGVSLYKAWNRAKEAAKEATQQMKAAKDIYDQSKEKLDDLKSSLESLKDAQNNLNELTTGTEEWKSALEDVNNQVIELLEKFPQLARYISTSSNGMLQISEAGQQEVIRLQKQAAQANAIGYISSRQRNDEANRNLEITQASRNWNMGSFDSSVLDKVITVVQQQGSNVLANTKELQSLTGANDKQIEAIDKHKSEIIALAEKLTANTIATDSLTQSIITGTFLDPEKIASSINSDIFTAQASKAITNASLNYQKYGIDPNKTYKNASYGEWQTALRSKQPGQSLSDFIQESGQLIISDESKIKIVERYKQINKDIADEISFSGGEIIRVAKDTGEKTKLQFDDIMKAVATADATTAQGMRHIEQQSERIAQQFVQKFGENATNIYKLSQGTAVAGEMSEKDLLNIMGDPAQLKYLEENFGITYQTLVDFFVELTHGINDYIQSLPQQIGQTVKKLITDKSGISQISEAAQKVIGSSLQNAWKNGTYDQYLDVLKNVDPKDMQGVSQFIDSLGEEISSIDTSIFIERLSDLGIELDNSAKEKVPQLIEALKQLNGINLQEGLGQLYSGTTSFLEKYAKDADATLSKKEFQSLSQIATSLDMDLSQFFEQTWKGTYKLKTSASEFFDYVNNQSLDGFKAALERTKNDLSQLNIAGFLKEQMGGNVTTAGLTERNTRGDNRSLTASANFLQGVGETDESIQRVLDAVSAGLKVQQEDLNTLNDLLVKHKDEWDNIDQSIKKAETNVNSLQNQEAQMTAQQEKMRQQFRQMQLDDDVNADKWKDYTEQIQKLGSAIKGVSNDVKKFKRNAEDVAEEILRFASAAQQVEKNFDDWNEVLNDSNASINDVVDTLMELQNAYKDVLGFHQSTTLGEDFLKDAQNLDLMRQAIEGVDGAYQELQLRAGASALSQIVPELNYDQAYAQLQQGMANLQALADASDLKIEAGAQIHDEAFIAGLENLINGLIAVGDTADQIAAKANSVLDAYGIDAQVQPIISQTQDTQQQVGWNVEASSTPVTGTYHQIVDEKKGTKKPVTYTDYIPTVKYTPVYETATTVKDVSAASVKLSNAHFKAGGATKIGSPKKVSSGGGGGGGGSKPKSSSTPKKADISGQKKTSVQVQRIANPYEQVEKSYDRQEKKLKKLTDLQDNLSGADRLKNLDAQNKALEKQNEIIDKRRKISKDSKQEGTTAYYKKQLKKTFGKDAFDKNGQINQTYIRNEAADRYENEDAKAIEKYNKKFDEYTKWWKGLSDEQAATDANKKKKQQYEKELKRLDKLAKKDQEKAKERYQTRIKWLEQYQDRLKQDEEFYERYLDNIRKMIENNIAKSKIKVDLAIDFGNLERDFLDFRNKVVRKINKDDILANSKAIRDEINSYYDSKELEKTASQIEKLSSKIADIQSGRYKGTYGLSAKEFKKYDINSEDFKNLQREYLDKAREDLQNYVKQYMDSLEDIQKLRDDVYDNYLDSIDDIQDKMDQVIDQYQRINDLVNHRIKLTQLLYGDNAGASIVDKYYQKQEQNNIKQMQALKEQADYWKARMNEAVVGSDVWKKYKEDYENVIDSIYDALEDQLDIIAEKFQNRVNIAIQNITKKLTSGLGNDYLEQEWDYISKDDSSFLDIVNKKFGIEQVQQLYTKAIEEAGDTAYLQQRINSLMQKQLKILNEKDKLTQYDIDRAKAALEVEKARIALEESRNQKTRMRLRRDSQGNYTYQYVQDEDKLNDLQSALADAQKELYNMDKEHYQSQLNQMYDVYKDYIEKMSELESEYASTRDQAEQERIQKQMDLLRDKYTDYFNDVNNDLLYTLSQYLTESYGDAMNVNIKDFTPEQAIQYLKKNLPYVNSQMQSLAENIKSQDGIAKATQSYYSQLVEAANQAAEAQKDALNIVNMSQQELVSGEDTYSVNNIEKYIGYYEDLEDSAKDVRLEMQKLVDQIDSFLNKDFTNNGFVNMLQTAYETLQDINNLNGKNGSVIDDDILDYYRMNQEQQRLQTEFDTASTSYKRAREGAYILSKQAMSRLDTMSAEVAQRGLSQLYKYIEEMDNARIAMENINKEALVQSVDINATFPNVENSKQIEEAIQSLVTRASQQVART